MGAGQNHAKGSLFNGSSLSKMTGAVPTAKTVIEVRLPASSISEVLETIHRLGRTGALTVNFTNGRAGDLKWSSSQTTQPPDV